MATLTYTVKETVTINGKVVGNEIVKAVTGVDKYQQFTMTVPTSTMTPVAVFGSIPEYGTIEDASLKYIRITNLDSTNFINLQFSYGATTAVLVVQAGGSFILTVDSLNANQLDTIKAQADTADCEIEVFIGIA